ncbi:hypothetical protein C8J55DRAFT_563418 [Lentinula edodes]|uniref:Uncharacterized protein n=1 Tax=Lentinula lateritia TaxID=40482 RepID=A0A9W9DI51_9AGAR|nr:hypothetical protein C8J55DRAFT_563418 [Lentinula edodes]
MKGDSNGPEFSYLDTYGVFTSGRSYGRAFDPYGDGDNLRANFASVSQRAQKAESDAEAAFLKHLASADTSKGPVTEEIIKFHLVPDMKTRFHKFVKGYGCTATSRKLTREEQDKINKTRKSLMLFTSVTVTLESQKAYLDKQAAKKGGPSTNAASASTSKVSQPLSTKPRNTLKRSANQALEDAGPFKPTRRTKG